MTKVSISSACNNCKICIDICPMEVFFYDKKVKVDKKKECIECRACEVQCPKDAIKID